VTKKFFWAKMIDNLQKRRRINITAIQKPILSVMR